MEEAAKIPCLDYKLQRMQVGTLCTQVKTHWWEVVKHEAVGFSIDNSCDSVP